MSFRLFFQRSNRFYFLVLIGVSLVVTGCNYWSLVSSINEVLVSTSGDGIKNYFTFIYHAKNDPGILNFEGMNYPFGEHIVYTDCQPILSTLLRYLPFTHNYLV